MSKRDLVALTDLTREELLGLLARSLELWTLQKQNRCPQPLSGKTLAMLFAKASTRTRVSFEVGMYQLGGHAIMLSHRDSQMGRGEPTADTARVLSRYVDGVMIRTFSHAEVTELAAHATVPVINGLTDHLHPCQVLADLMTCAQAFGLDALGALRVAWVGDGNNMANSWINAAGVLGFELVLACPDGYAPDATLAAAARTAGATIRMAPTAKAAAIDAHVVTTDVWASMGQEAEAEARKASFAHHQVNEEVMAVADPEAIFLHCLPAHRGEEVTAGVIDGPQSRVFDEVENRLHAQKAVLEWAIGRRRTLD
jgi:ornithine carbamoyltransferase